MLSTPDGRSAGNAELMSPSRLVGPMALLLVLVPTTAGTMAMCAYPSSCSNGTAYHNSSQWRGKQLGNVTLDSPASLVGLICCSVAQGLGKQRSKNVTDGVPWSAQILGTSSKHKGQLSVLCIAYEYGASSRIGTVNHTAGFTPRLPPLPPAPPTCDSFKSVQSCPDRCFWLPGAGCAASPPIKCGCNTVGGCGNNALCIHVVINTTKVQTWDYLGDAASYNQTVIRPPPKSFSRDMWYSVWDGEAPTGLHTFRYCVQFQTSDQHEFAVCVSLDGASFDLQCATTKGLTYAGKWQSNAPFVAKVVIHDNVTDSRMSIARGALQAPQLMRTQA